MTVIMITILLIMITIIIDARPPSCPLVLRGDTGKRQAPTNCWQTSGKPLALGGIQGFADHAGIRCHTARSCFGTG